MNSYNRMLSYDVTLIYMRILLFSDFVPAYLEWGLSGRKKTMARPIYLKIDTPDIPREALFIGTDISENFMNFKKHGRSDNVGRF